MTSTVYFSCLELNLSSLRSGAPCPTRTSVYNQITTNANRHGHPVGYSRASPSPCLQVCSCIPLPCVELLIVADACCHSLSVIRYAGRQQPPFIPHAHDPNCSCIIHGQYLYSYRNEIAKQKHLLTHVTVKRHCISLKFCKGPRCRGLTANHSGRRFGQPVLESSRSRDCTTTAATASLITEFPSRLPVPEFKAHAMATAPGDRHLVAAGVCCLYMWPPMGCLSTISSKAAYHLSHRGLQ